MSASGTAVAGPPRTRVPPQVLLGGAAVSLQIGSALATRLFPAVGALGVLALRTGVAALCLVLAGRSWRVRPTGRARWLVVAFGAVLGTMNLVFYSSLERIPLGVTVALELLGPLGVAVAGSRSRRDLAFAALAVAGVGVLVGPTALGAARSAGGGLDPLGIAFALAAAACWAGYILLGSRLSRVMPGTSGLAWAMAAAALVLVPLGAAHAGAALWTPSHLATGAAIGVLSGALPYGVELVTMRRVGPRAFGVMMSLEPAAALLAGLVVAHQEVSALSLVGIAVVVVASLGTAPQEAR